MFRFLCCFRDFLASVPADAAEWTLLLTTFSPCNNSPPYRVSDRDIVPHLVAFGVTGPREVARLRKEGASGCLRRCLEHASSSRTEDANGRLFAELTRRSVGPTTLHALGIEDDVALREQVDVACSPILEAS